MTSKILFFTEQKAWRRWLKANHRRALEQWVGFHKKGSGKPSITWPQSVDEALCFGWIDGLRNNIDETSYKIRFTPRKPGSIWSSINTKRVRELDSLGLVTTAGLSVFEERNTQKSGSYSYEQRNSSKLEPGHQKRLRSNEKAWAFFQARPPWYQKAATWWIISGKRAETRMKRLDQLIQDCENGLTIAPLTRPTK